MEKTDEDKIVKIAGRGIEVYNQTILNKFQKYDQIELCITDNYLERALTIIRLWEALGVVPEDGPQIKFVKTEEDIVLKDGQKKRDYINRITLTKQPNQFRFTKN